MVILFCKFLAGENNQLWEGNTGGLT